MACGWLVQTDKLPGGLDQRLQREEKGELQHCAAALASLSSQMIEEGLGWPSRYFVTVRAFPCDA